MHHQRTEPRISIAVMSHPRRKAEADALARQLGDAMVVFDPHPGTNPTPLKTAIQAWRAVEPGATHHLVVQDDIVPSEGFLKRVQAGVRLFPDATLTFYANWSSQNGAAVRLAAAAGATWVEDNGVEYFPTLAQVMPASYIDDYIDLAMPFAQWWVDDDDVMREFLTSRSIDAYLSVPCLVEHSRLKSLIGNDSQGARLAACFDMAPVHDGSYEALAHSIDYVPWLKAGRVLSMVRTAIAGKYEYLRRPWTALLEPLGLDAGELRNSYDAFVARSSRLQKASDDLGDMFTHSLWLMSCLMATVLRRNMVPVRVLSNGAATRAGDPIACAGLSTLAPGAIRWTLLPARLLDTYSAEITELTEAGFTNGMISGEKG